MYEEHPDFPTPPDDTVIWRYMDLAKYVDLLRSAALYFARADKLGDPYEGSIPISTVRKRVATMAILQQQMKADTDLPTGLEHFKNLPRFTLVNAWHCSTYESDAMWWLYARHDSGLAVRTTVGDLKRSLGKVKDDNVMIGRITYVDYDTADFHLGNFLWLYLHKRLAFAHEQEVRAIILRSPLMIDLPDGTQRVDWTRDICDVGVRVPIDTLQLIQGVVVAPFAQEGYRGLVQDLTGRYGITVDVRQSELTRLPFWP